jgi:PDZ domain
MKLRAFAVLAVAAMALVGCVSTQTTPERTSGPSAPRAAAEPGRYISDDAHATERVAELRAAPPPQLAEISPGTAILGDERKLVARSYARIGTGCYRSNDDAARDWTLRNGTRVGAEKILVYTLPADGKVAGALAVEMQDACTEEGKPFAAQPPYVAVFYVRYKLPFGARFRDLRSEERKKLGVEFGVEIDSVALGTPAADANLRSGDFVLKLNGVVVRGYAAFGELLRSNMGKRVTLTVNRDGEQFDRLVRLGVLATESHKVEK